MRYHFLLYFLNLFLSKPPFGTAWNSSELALGINFSGESTKPFGWFLSPAKGLSAFELSD